MTSFLDVFIFPCQWQKRADVRQQFIIIEEIVLDQMWMSVKGCSHLNKCFKI